MHEYTDGEPVEPYDFGDSLAGGQVIAYEIGSISPDEAALHIPAVSALAVADGVIHYDEGLSFVPDGLMDDPDETKRGLAAAYARLSDELRLREPADRARRPDRRWSERAAAELRRGRRAGLAGASQRARPLLHPRRHQHLLEAEPALRLDLEEGDPPPLAGGAGPESSTSSQPVSSSSATTPTAPSGRSSAQSAAGARRPASRARPTSAASPSALT